MALLLLKCQKSTFLNKSSESDRAPSAQLLPQPKTTGHKNDQQPKASVEEIVPRQRKATFDVAKRFMEAIVFMKTPWPILPDDKYSMVEAALNFVIDVLDRQQSLAGAPAGTTSLCQLPSSPSHKIDPQTWDAVSLGLCLMLFSWIYDIDSAPNRTYLKPMISTIREWLANGAGETVVCSGLLALCCETELRIQVTKLLFDDAYLCKVVDDTISWFMRMEVLIRINH